MDLYGFYSGQEFEAYRFLGAHAAKEKTIFRTFAPNAKKVSVIGEFSGWEEIPMQKIYDGHFWECEVPEAKEGEMYKYRIYHQNGKFIDHCDPYAFLSEKRPKNASVIYHLDGRSFTDEKWMKQRSVSWNGPVNIYEMHFGSWKMRSETEGDWYEYDELSELLIPYLKENGYNFVELMPLSEHPLDGSWGYQNTGFFSPTSRYGTPDQLRAFVDQCHANQIGVIMDFVPVHFAVNDYALWNYDGSAVYEYPYSDMATNEWGSCNFMHSKGEVRSFLQSAAHYWLKEFHFDGLRMDAVSNLIYWQGNSSRGENKGAIDFIKNMNCGLKARFPDAMLIAEDSSSYPGVTKPVFDGGLGFDYKWDLGWMNDTLTYFKAFPWARSNQDLYHKLTFSMMYFYNEKFILPFSHDEVVHGKATIVQKMHGDYDIKFPQVRALYLYMMAHPGKKLNFMGNEFAQFREWDETKSQDWFMLKYPIHDAFHHFMRDLNRIYLKSPALYEEDYSGTGFQWLDCHQEAKCIYAIERSCKSQRIAAVFNFSGTEQTYDLSVPDSCQLKRLIASDNEIYNGTVKYTDKVLKPENGTYTLKLTPFSGQYFLVS